MFRVAGHVWEAAAFVAEPSHSLSCFPLCIYCQLLADVKLLMEPIVSRVFFFFVVALVDLHFSPDTTEGNVQSSGGQLFKQAAVF